jgi:hypothetical protein
VLIRGEPLEALARYGPGELAPVRIPPAYKGSRHLPGLFWMSQLGRLVSYESRLEMVILKRLDFERDLENVLPQPFMLHFSFEGEPRTQVPDYLAWYRGRPPLLVNVKPRQYVDRESNRRAFAACKAACEQLGWSYVTESEPDATLLANLQWLAGFRRPPPDLPRYAPLLMDRLGAPMKIEELLADAGPPALVRPVLFHLLWTRLLSFAPYELLTDASVVRFSAGPGSGNDRI